MKRPADSPRYAALQCLLRWQAEPAFAETLVSRSQQQFNLSPADYHLVQALVFGVLRHRTWLDHIINSLCHTPPGDHVRLILQLGLAQILLLKLPHHAAVNETVKLANNNQKGFVNAILRNVLRQQEQILLNTQHLPLAVRYSTPAWLVERWEQQFGTQATHDLLAWNNSTPLLYARINPDTPPAGLPEQLIPVEHIPGWYRVQGSLPLEHLNKGLLYMADPSTRYAVELLAPQAGETILDACAAPGGKSIAILQAVHGQLRLTATDLHKHRLQTLEENLTPHHAFALDIRQCDWSQPCPPDLREHFNAVLLDVPCSNTGVIQRRVDVRWRLSQTELQRLCQLQQTMLHHAAQAVKPGGRLVYSTCSIDRAEDADQIRSFLASHPGWTLQTEKLVLPHIEKSDGAYAALLLRA